MPARPKLAVILGAGASYDACPLPDPGDAGTITGRQWRPPLVKTMFETGAFHEILRDHPEAAAVMSWVRTDIRGGMPFEQSLRRYVDSTDPNVQRLVPFVPVALHQFFVRVSTIYTYEATNYSHLVNRTTCQGIHTAYITLNYDTLLEKSLSRITGVGFDSIESYISSPDWILVKLHGSVGWGYPWYVSRPGGDASARLRSNAPPERHDDQIEAGVPESMYLGDRSFYPALALPVLGKSGFICPPRHVEALKRFLVECENFLLIGFSANDADLLELLQQTIGAVRRLRVVTGGDLRDVFGRLWNGVRQFREAPFDIERDGYDSGFTHFLANDLDPIVASLTG